MNERIKQLYEQAIEQHVSNNMAWEELNPEKFAELIVRECAEVAHCNFHVDGLTLGSIMKEHFGVKK
jgi:hypothetical protein